MVLNLRFLLLKIVQYLRADRNHFQTNQINYTTKSDITGGEIGLYNSPQLELYSEQWPLPNLPALFPCKTHHHQRSVSQDQALEL